MRHIPGVILHYSAFPQSYIDARPGQKLVDDITYEHIHGNGWKTIGYNYCLTKDTDGKYKSFDGRPDSMMGAHCLGYNDWIGICVGIGLTETPPEEMLVALASLIADLSHAYGFPLDRNHVQGHRDFLATECPGAKLYAKIDHVIDLARRAGTPKPLPLQAPPKDSSQEKHISSIDLQWGSGTQTQALLVEDTSYMPITLLEKISTDFGFPLDVGYVSAKDSKTGKPYVTIQRKK